MSQRDFSENEPECTPELPAANRALFLDKVRQSNAACQAGDFNTAVTLYTDALQLDPTNHILFSNRSAARLKQGQFSLALQDATKARELCSQWPKAYFRQGVALQCLGRYGEALASFSAGLGQDVNNKQLLAGLIEATIKSPLRHALEPTFQQLRMMKLDQSPFVVISVVGQELLQAGQYHAAVTVLEAALRIGSCSLKLRGSVFSALSSAHWALNQLDKAIGYMQQDLAVAKSLGDTAGECRAHGNLGSAYFSQGSFKEALTAHRYQLVLAMKCKDTQAAAAALTSLGHVYTAIGDYPNALASHKQCVQLVKQMGDRLQEAREIGNVGAVYLAMGEFDSAVDCHTQHLRLARKLNHQVEEARAYSNLGSSHHYRRNFVQAIQYHEQVLRIAQQLGDRAIEARAYAGLGHASRCASDFGQAKRWHEKQLEMALAARDKMGEGRACSNLGIVYQLLGEHDAALKLHQAHLTISRLLQDRAGMGRAYGNIGNAYSAAGLYEAAIKYHKQELTISKEVHDRSAEASTHGNLAVAYQALGAHDMALMHYRAHLNIARELKDTAGEACALLNMGNCLSSRQEFGQAVPYYEQYLMLSQELGDVRAEGKACHFLGYAHYCIGNYREAVRYYDQDLALAKDLQDKMNMGRAYCNLGLAHLALGNSASALECQKYFLAIAHMTNHLAGKFRALGNIGDVLVRAGDIEEAAKMYHRQLALARQGRERPMEAAACGALGLAHRLMKKFEKALGYHTQELTLRQELCDLPGECRSHGHLGAVHMALGNYQHAVKCYQEQLERAQELQDSAVEAQAYGNLGIAKLNMGHYEDAIGYLEQQMGTLEQVSLPTAQHDRARALGHLGDCYDALGDFEEGIKCHERHLQLASGLQSPRDQERAYRGLGHSHRALGNLQEALVCLEKRLVVSHELGSLEAKAAAYGDLGYIHSALGNHEQAVNCLEHQRDIANDLGDRMASSDATSGLGAVFLKMGDLEGALKLHQMDLEQCDEIGLHALQARACGNLGLVYEALRNYSESVQYFEKQLGLTVDRLVKANACGALGRVFHTMGEISQSINFLRQGLAIAQSLNQSEEEARIRHRLGVVLIASGDNENARSQLEIAAEVLETVRSEQRTPEARAALFDLQTTCYHTLQKTLVAMNRTEEALVAAERCKARNCGPQKAGLSRRSLSCSENIFDIVNRCKQDILYFSLAEDELYTWFLQPQKRIVRFHMAKIDETTLVMPSKSKMLTANGSENSPTKPVANGSLLEQYINMVRDSLGVNSDNVLQEGDGSAWRSSENLLDDFANERQGFMRMVNRNHLLNSSNYSLSSLFSLGSVGGSVASLQGSTRSIGSLQGSQRSRRVVALPPWQGPSSLHALYNLLLKPFDDLLPSSMTTERVGHKELILVLESELYLVPFAVLRSGQDGGEYLSERCSILTVPSLQTLRQKSRQKTRDPPENLNSALVVGGPRIPSSLAESWGWSDSPASLQEAAMVSDMLQAKALVSTNATKEGVLAELPSAECVHFAANLSWKQGAIVLSPGEMIEPQGKKRFGGYGAQSQQQQQLAEADEDAAGNTGAEIPPLSDFMLSAADVLSLKLNAKLIVLSSYHSLEPISGAGVAVLASSWLTAGAGAILVSLWPVPETAAKILLRAFYSALLQGARAARALAEAMQTVQHTKHFAHPANWAGFLLIGGNIRLSNKVALIGQALCELMRTPDKCRDALRVCLHLVEKSLQRIHRGQKNAMYTTQKSIDNKAGSVNGWKDLLMAVGFRFEPAANGIPSSVFFPQTDPEDRLSQCSASLQALLGLSPTSLHALSKLVNNPEIADDIIAVIKDVVAQYPPKGSPDLDGGASVEIPLSVRLWRVSGCHELLASLGFDLMEVGQDQVTLRTGKQANRRSCHFVLQALLALFDTQEAPKSLGLDSCSSSESLNDDDDEDSMSETANDGGGASSITTIATAPAHLMPQQRSVSPVLNGSTANSAAASATPASGSKHMSLSRPPLPFRRGPISISTGGAFTSYVRRRGEPDGGRTDAESAAGAQQQAAAAIHSARMAAAVAAAAQEAGSSQTNTTDSELSDGYTSQTLNKFEPKPKMGFSSLRAPVKVGRPGGGGESDAAFTPSPPVTMDANVSLALAHQTRIRHLYNSAGGFAGGGNEAMMGISGGQQMIARRPDSSSSASSTTDWEGSGHATVLRRANQQQQQQQMLPPLPPPRQTMPLVDSLRPLAPLAPVYNNLGLKQVQGQQMQLQPQMPGDLNATSSDSEFERGGFEAAAAASVVANSSHIPGMGIGQRSANGRMKIKPLRNITDHTMDFMERFAGGQQMPPPQQPQITKSGRSKASAASTPMTSEADQQHHHQLGFNANNLYFSPAGDSSDPMLDATKKELMSMPPSHHQHHHQHLLKKPDGGKLLSAAHNKTVQDSIMRHMNREMTPTISEVYHERSLGLGLAPPLSKLLLSKNYDEAGASSSAETNVSVSAGISVSAMLKESVNDLDIASAAASMLQQPSAAGGAASMTTSTPNHKDAVAPVAVCKTCHAAADMMCGCKTGTTKKKSSNSAIGGGSKPWLSNVLPNIMTKSGDASSAESKLQTRKRATINAAAAAAAEAESKGSNIAGPATAGESGPISVATLTRNAEAAVAAAAAGGGQTMPPQKRSNSPLFSDLSRRDDGDGRSVADSQCSGNYSKVDISSAVAQKQQQLLRAKFAAVKMSGGDEKQ